MATRFSACFAHPHRRLSHEGNSVEPFDVDGQSHAERILAPSCTPAPDSALEMISSVMASLTVDAFPSGPGERIWQGNLNVRGNRNNIAVPCVGVRYLTPNRPSIIFADGWPQNINCD